MAFFKNPVSAPRNPLADLPPTPKAAYAEAPHGNATMRVVEVKGIESTSSQWKGLVWECEITLDGAGTVLRGGQRGIKGVELMATITPKEGDLSTLDQAADNGRIESRFGALYAAEGEALAVNDLGFLTPGGRAFDDPDLEAALKKIEGRECRVVVWSFKGRDGLGVGVGQVRAE